ncbi:MAG: Asp23/Gls24 family envelope stress response protein [Clostridia bacterium]|nr:Asp23/Gls24 family envelope stress response protein [Clostridia bacterium]
MSHFKKFTQKKNEGKVVYGDGIVSGIVLIALAEIPYAELYSTNLNKKLHKNAIKVSFDKDGVHIEVAIKVNYQQSVSDMAFKIQETVRHTVESMTEYHVASVNVIVKDVLFEDKFVADKQKTEEKTGASDVNQPKTNEENKEKKVEEVKKPVKTAPKTKAVSKSTSKGKTVSKTVKKQSK